MQKQKQTNTLTPEREKNVCLEQKNVVQPVLAWIYLTNRVINARTAHVTLEGGHQITHFLDDQHHRRRDRILVVFNLLAFPDKLPLYYLGIFAECHYGLIKLIKLN